MKCHEFQTLLGAQPSSTDAELLAHVEECSTCARYREELQAMDRLIYRALAVPADMPSPKPVANEKNFGWRIAASLVASVALGGSIWVATTRESFAEQIATHTHHEAFALVPTDEHVDAQQLSDILAKSNLRLRPGAAHVSYASSCPFRGHEVPHLVVQSNEGPVTVMVLVNEEPTGAMQRIKEHGYEGVIVPAPRGVIAVLGKNVPVENTAQKFLEAIQY